MAIPVLTIGDCCWSFGDNPSAGSFRVQPLWVMGVSSPAVHRLEPDLGVGRSRGVSQCAHPGASPLERRPPNE